MNIKEVAREAEVSVTTVSRVLNHPENVSGKTRAHVLDVMDRMNYTPNWFARNIRSGKTNVIGLVVPNILDPGNMELAKGVEEVAHQNGCNILMCNTEYGRSKELECTNALIERKVDGIVLIATLLEKKDLSRIRGKGISCVLVGKNESFEDENLVYTDCREAVGSATKHLFSLGRKNIAMVLGNSPKMEMGEKLAGYKDALKESGVKFNSELLAEAENSIEGGFLAAGKLLDNGRPFDAIMASTDLMAYGVLENLKQKGIRVPEDIALVGYDDLKMCAVIEPKLTSVTKPMYRMGLMATRLLFDNIEGNDVVAEQILLQSKLKIRKSCGNKERLKEIW